MKNSGSRGEDKRLAVTTTKKLIKQGNRDPADEPLVDGVLFPQQGGKWAEKYTEIELKNFLW